MGIKSYIKNRFSIIGKIQNLFNIFYFLYIQGQETKNFGYRDPASIIIMPAHISNPKNVFMYEQTRIQAQSKIITHTGKFIMKRYSGAAPGLTVITGNHIPTVGISHYSLPLLRINEKEKDVIVEEDVWLGANVTLLSGVTVGRGAIAGACCVVSKDVPPYAVVVGNPARIIASKFTIQQILKHEAALYEPQERYSKEALEELFEKHFKGKKTIGTEMPVDKK